MRKRWVAGVRFVLLRALALSAAFSGAFAHPALAARSGDDGQSGRSETITLTGHPLYLDLRGGDGERGRDGDDGRDGRCRSYTDDNGNTVRDDVAGTHGEDGGHGGDGGNGGNATLIYSDRAQLRSVRIDAQGGRGAPGGDGGRGGRGCPDGYSGSDGRHGQDGSTGSLALISSVHLPLQADTSRLLVSLRELLGTVPLTRQIWASFAEAGALLASGSSVGYFYSELQGYEHGTYRVAFAPDAAYSTALLSDRVLVSLYDGATAFNAPEHVVLGRALSSARDGAFEISRIYRASVFNSNRYARVTGNAGARKIQFETEGQLVPKPVMDLGLKVEVKVGIFKWRTLFNGQVAQSFVTSTEKGYAVDLDRLALSEKILPRVKLRLTMNQRLRERSLRSAVKSETWVVVVN
jgi:hypothetical protein